MIFFFFFYRLIAEQRIKNAPKRKRSYILNKVKSGGGGGGGEAAGKCKSKAAAAASAKSDDSDDSIGSASDLRAREEQEEADEKEDSETMTVNDSVLTCGSSAYHAECESMAREELPSQGGRPRYPRMADLPEHKEVDSLFGHSYGERPLLADDELDKGDAVSPAPLIDMTDDQPPAGRARRPPESATAADPDVFSMAPFKVLQKKRSRGDGGDDDDDEAGDDGEPPPPPDEDLLITMSPPVAEGSLLDLGEAFAVRGGQQRRGQEAACADNNPFSASFQPPLAERAAEDLFGAVPFDRMAAVSVSNSSRNSNEVDDFITFGAERPDEFAKGYEFAGRSGTVSAGIHNMSFEDLPAGSASDYEFRQPSYGNVFFQPAKSNNPFS